MKKQIEQAGGPAAFSRRTGIPLRTVENWKYAKRSPPTWLVPILSDWLSAKRRGEE